MCAHTQEMCTYPLIFLLIAWLIVEINYSEQKKVGIFLTDTF